MLKHDAAPPLHVKERGFSPLAPDSLKSCYNNFSRPVPTVLSDGISAPQKREMFKGQVHLMCGGRVMGKKNKNINIDHHFPFSILETALKHI